jgi:chromosome segregation protein
MRPNALYQRTVASLETVLPPRVVSRALKDGLDLVERDAGSVEIDDIERILKQVVFRALQTTMSVDAARQTVSDTIEALRAEPPPPPPVTLAEPEPAAPAAAATDLARLGALRAAMRPFNLYFGWPEVRKLRAQVQVIEQELEAGGGADVSMAEAEAQLRVVEQKLEDQLVLQARDLGELEEALEAVQALEDPRVRRLDALVGQVRHAQRDRTLAEGEVDRSRKLARDLRKLLESTAITAEATDELAAAPDAPTTGAPASRVDTGSAAAEAIGAAAAADGSEAAADRRSQEVSDRIHQIDLEAERGDLAALRGEHAELLRYLPPLAERFGALEGRLDEGASVGDDLAALASTLTEAAATQRDHLRHELEAAMADVGQLHPEVDASALRRAVTVAQEVLEETLPAFDDVTAIRDLHRGALERSDELRRREAEAAARLQARLGAQREVLERLDEALGRAPTGDADLEAALDTVRSARDALAAATREGHADEGALSAAREAEAALERAVAERADDTHERLRARLRALAAELSALPDLGAIRARASALRDEITRVAQSGATDDAHVTALASLAEQLHADAVAETARRIDQLGKEAGDSVGKPVLRALQAAARGLAAGQFPDLEQLREVIDREREAALDRDLARWQRLQQTASRLEGSGVEAVERLRHAMTVARTEIDAGRGAGRHLDAAERVALDVEVQMRERVEAFGPRLDAALRAFAAVERLNNDDVAAARRILSHLDSQREAVDRVSPGLQNQLVSSLAEAESLLGGLAEAYEATRAVADELVTGNVLDDVLGSLDSLAAQPAGEPDALERLARGYLELDTVSAFMVIDGQGVLRAGTAGDLRSPPVLRALAQADADWEGLGDHLGSGVPELVDIDLGTRRAVVALLGAGAHAVAIIEDANAVGPVTARLRSERDQLRDALAARA